MTSMRVLQANLTGAAGLVSLEDGRLQWLDEYEIRRVARAGVVEAE
jgi:hypothetical protein